MIKKGDMVVPTARAAQMYGTDKLGVNWPCEVVNIFNNGSFTVAQFLCNDVYNHSKGMVLRSWDVRSLQVHCTTQKVHVTEIIGATHDGKNNAKARDSAGIVYAFRNGKWHLWSRECHSSDWITFTQIPGRKHYQQPIGMFIRVEV